jgi:predicted transcriptional regulator
VSEITDTRFPESGSIKGERRQTARQEYTMRVRMLDVLRGGPKTIPEIAAALNIAPHEATWWLMGYVRYGFVAATEETTDGGYYKYKIVEGK